MSITEARYLVNKPCKSINQLLFFFLYKAYFQILKQGNMMASSQKRTTVREDSKDMYLDQEYVDVEHLSIDEDLLTDVHIDFGQEQEDSVFDQSLMQYLDQLPIAPPPSAASYSASFIEMVLQDIEDFKEDNLYHGRDSQPAFDYEFDFNKSVSDLQLEEEEEHVVEQSRRYQEYFNKDEVPIQFTGMEDESSRFAPTYKSPLSDFSLRYNNLVDPVIYQEQDEQPNFDQEQDSFDDLLYEDNDSKDFSSWLCYDMDDENGAAHFKVFIFIGITFIHTKYFIYKRRTLTIHKSCPEMKMKTKMNTNMNITKTKKRSITVYPPNILLNTQIIKIKIVAMKMHISIKIERIYILMLNILI